MTSDEQRFSSAFSNGLATFTFERPEILNALDASNLHRLREELENAGRDPSGRIGSTLADVCTPSRLTSNDVSTP